MPISFSMMVLSSQLVIAVADEVPKFDIAKSCKFDVAATTGLTDNEPVKSCMNDEQKAQQQLASQWSTFPAANGAQCGSMEAIGGTPSYVSLLTCLQMDQIAKITARRRLAATRQFRAARGRCEAARWRSASAPKTAGPAPEPGRLPRRPTAQRRTAS
jgi:hypothetical protein